MTMRELHTADCREAMATMADASVDAIVTDPPYELGFMGKTWDANGIAYDPAVWGQALRVLKPGGHMLAFGGSRTYHRMACAIEDAGFDIRDQIMWVYGSGFPKSRTALKPAHEPIVVARKRGTGKLNIDACRIEGTWAPKGLQTGLGTIKFFTEGETPRVDKSPHPLGRWPANLIHDGETDLGEAARFFYCAKASKAERGEDNTHPTVKPIDLMRYLVQLVAPPGGTVLDPFMGSGTTGIACKLLGLDFIGIEVDPIYCETARQRIVRAIVQLDLLEAAGV